MVSTCGSIFRYFSESGSVSSEVFAQWWLFEDRANHLAAFLEKHFPGTLQLERFGVQGRQAKHGHGRSHATIRYDTLHDCFKSCVPQIKELLALPMPCPFGASEAWTQLSLSASAELSSGRGATCTDSQSRSQRHTETQQVVSRHISYISVHKSFAAELFVLQNSESFQVFRVLEESRDELHLHEYGVSQTLAVAGCGFLFLSFHRSPSFIIICNYLSSHFIMGHNTGIS